MDRGYYSVSVRLKESEAKQFRAKAAAAGLSYAEAVRFCLTTMGFIVPVKAAPRGRKFGPGGKHPVKDVDESGEWIG